MKPYTRSSFCPGCEGFARCYTPALPMGWQRPPLAGPAVERVLALGSYIRLARVAMQRRGATEEQVKEALQGGVARLIADDADRRIVAAREDFRGRLPRG